MFSRASWIEVRAIAGSGARQRPSLRQGYGGSAVALRAKADYHPVVDSPSASEASPMTSSHPSASPSAGIWTGSLTDFRHAFRLLWKSKRITATTLVTLALCIGATTAIFSSVYALRLKRLPYQEPEWRAELYTSAVKAGLNHM